MGRVGVGGENSICIQSMTTTPTDDIEATIEQIIQLADAGCQIVRVTVQGKKEALACEGIKKGLLERGYEIPIVADIHFYPPAAMIVADFVDKVRINPGNFADRRATFKQIEYTDESYQAEIEKIEEKFVPLVLKMKKLGKPMRIGCNHGSLSDRIMNRYGDTPMGMVESALEFTRIARAHDYHDIIFSMKASNPLVMIAAYRLLAEKLEELGWNYPLHLGVTEAGEGEDGRIKSAIGIGSLLLDGIGDTIRVSLTEDPWKEIDPCQRLSRLQTGSEPYRLYDRHRKESWVGTNIEGKYPFEPNFVLDRKPVNLREGKKLLFGGVQDVRVTEEGDYSILKEVEPERIFVSFQSDRVDKTRRLKKWLHAHDLDIPLVLSFRYEGEWDDAIIWASSECGSLLCDGIGDGILLEGPFKEADLVQLSFNILQGTRRKTIKTEFISCPSCGRTLFELQEVAARIRKRTHHLPGVKIAIMGCIVNGPGEMADADFGYVGSKPGKIDLYVGKECVERNIDFSDADDQLVALIQKHNMWVDP